MMKCYSKCIWNDLTETIVFGGNGANNMDLKKGLTYIARGYLFILINFTLDITDMRISIDILPDFIGWIFIFLAIDCLGEYITHKSFAKWTAIAMVILSLLNFYYWPEDAESGIDVIFVIINVLSTFCLYTILDAVEKVAKDYGSLRETNIRKLKGFLIVKLIVDYLSGALFFAGSALLLMVILVVEFIYFISIAINLYKLRDEVIAKTNEDEN